MISTHQSYDFFINVVKGNMRIYANFDQRLNGLLQPVLREEGFQVRVHAVTTPDTDALFLS